MLKALKAAAVLLVCGAVGAFLILWPVLYYYQ